MSYLHKDRALICKCDGFIYELILARFALFVFRYEIHSSSIILCILPQIKSGLFKCIFSTIQKPYLCVYSNSAMADASDAMKHEWFAGGNFRRWQTRVKFWLMSMGLWWVIHPMMPFMV